MMQRRFRERWIERASERNGQRPVLQRLAVDLPRYVFPGFRHPDTRSFRPRTAKMVRVLGCPGHRPLDGPAHDRGGEKCQEEC